MPYGAKTYFIHAMTVNGPRKGVALKNSTNPGQIVVSNISDGTLQKVANPPCHYRSPQSCQTFAPRSPARISLPPHRSTNP